MGIYAFASHKGGVGKTTLLFHAACQKAQANPTQTVLVIDLTKMGDTSKMFLGDRDALNDVAAPDASAKSTTAFFEHLEELSLTSPVKPKVKGTPAGSGLRGTLFGMLTPGGSSAVGPEPEEETSRGVWKEYAVQVSQHNANVPTNVYLIAGGPLPSALTMFDAAQQSRIADMIRSDLSSADLTVVMDTDGDLPVPKAKNLPPVSHPYTRIAMQSAQGLLVAAKASKADVDRVAMVCQELTELRSEAVRGKPVARFQSLIWNDVDLYRWEPANKFAFTMPQAAQDIVTNLTTLVYNTATAYPDTFFQPATQGAPDSFDSFLTNSTLAVPHFATTVVSSTSDLRTPFCCMSARNRQSSMNENDINRHVKIIQQIVDVLV